MTMVMQYILKLDDFEHGILVNALNSIRNQLIQEGSYNDDLDRLILKVIDLPVKKRFGLI